MCMHILNRNVIVAQWAVTKNRFFEALLSIGLGKHYIKALVLSNSRPFNVICSSKWINPMLPGNHTFLSSADNFSTV